MSDMASFSESMALPAQQLVDELDQLAAEERRCSAKMLAHLAAMDERTVYRGRGYHSLYDYCTRNLRFSEAIAYWRMHAARAAKRCEEIIPLLEAGDLTLATINVFATLIIEGKAG